MSDRQIEFQDELPPEELAQQKVRAVLIVDRSGSMKGNRPATVAFFNDQLKAIAVGAMEMDTRVSLIVFNDTPTVVTWNSVVDRIRPWTLSDYNPNGGTALRDAVGLAITQLDQDPAIADPKTSVLVIILTDGYENASKNYSPDQLAKMIQAKQETERWTFTYMGANQDLSKVAEELKMPSLNTVAYASTPEGTLRASAMASGATSRYLMDRRRGRMSSDNFYAPPSPEEIALRRLRKPPTAD